MVFKKSWLIGLVVVSLWACKKNVPSDTYLEEVARYISAYTGGAIHRSDAILVRFARAAVGREQVGQKVSAQAWSVSPSIAGEAIWQDEYTLRLQPKEPLPYGKRYKAKVALRQLFGDVSEAAQTFEFSFAVRPLAFEVQIDGVRAREDARQQQVVGSLRTNDPVESAAVEQVLSAHQDATRLPIRWTHAADGRLHTFVVDEVVRSATRSQVSVRWSGKPLGLPEKNGAADVVVPATGEFTLLSARIVPDAEPYVLLNFSDPISTNTPLDGLIRMADPSVNLRFAVNGNFVRVYPRSSLTGRQRLIVERGLRSTGGTLLDGRSEWPLDFGVLHPAVRLVGRGAIIPKNSDGQVILPFEAVGLRAIDLEIFKVFQSNVLQFLQTNDIEGESELERVGKIVHQQKVALTDLNPEADSHGWQRYALNLANFINKDPGAIYQVRLSFRRSYTTHSCPPSANDEEEELARFGKTNEQGQLVSLWGGYRGIYYSENWNDGEEYNWEDRDNPCAREYYHKEHFAYRNVFVSDLGLSAKWGRDRSLFLCVTSLATAQPESGAKITLLNYQLQPIAETQTGSSGTAIVENLRETPFLVVATRGDQRGYLRLADGATLSLSRFDVAGIEPQKGLKGYLYGERGVWRPGDSLYLNFVLEDRTGQLPAAHPVGFELRDPRGALYYRTATAQHVGGVYAFHCATRPDAPTGNWTARVEVGGASFTQTLKIETVKPNRLKIALDLGKKILTAGNEPGAASLHASWLHGAPAAGLNARVEMQLSSGETTFKNFRDFVFDDPTRNFWSDAETIFDGYLDESGRATVPLRLSNIGGEAPGRLVVRFKTRVFERGGDFSTDNFAVDYYPYPRFVGVSIPKDQGGYKSIGLHGGEIQVACVDANGNPLPNRKVSVGLYRCDWRWWWDEYPSYDVAQFNTTDHVGAIEKAVVVTNSRGIATWKIKPAEWGRYLVRALDEDGGHAGGDYFWTGYPSELNDLRSRNAVAMLPFSVGKEKYVVGEKVSLRVPASENGRILLTLENGSRVVEHRWFEAKAGDNVLTFEASAQMVPNVYAHISLFQPYAQTANDLPIRMYGVMPVMVENPATRLKPELQVPAVIRPGQPFTVSLRETSGKACTYTLAIVDEGLLDLTRFTTPNPWDAFYAREALGVKTWDVYDYVLGAFGASLERILSIGGDAINQKSRQAAQINRFKPVVRHLGPFRLEKGQTAKHQLTLENYVGSVRVMAVCSAPASNGKGAYGAAEKTCAVRKPVMVLPTLPRVLGPGEKVRLPVEVFAVEKSVKSATVRLVEKHGKARISGPNSHTLTFDQPGSQVVYFDVQVGNKTGVAEFIVEATGAGETSREAIEIAIRNPNPVQTAVWDGAAEPGREWSESLDLSRYSDLNRLVLEVSTLPPINLNRHLDYLLRYPHGCLEQITSGAFPQLYADLIAPLSKEQEEQIRRNITATIERIRRYQQADGSFAYWPGSGSANSWSNTYAGHFLLEAKAKGYALPPGLLEPWLDRLAQTARSWTPSPSAQSPWMTYDSEINQAYRLYALALAGKPDLGSMNRLKEQKDLYTPTALLLASAYAQAGKAEVARDLTRKKWREDWEYTWSGRTFSSSLRDQALRLETFTALGDNSKAEAIVQNICTQLGSEPNWEWNTQSLAVALRALAKYANRRGTDGPQYTYRLAGGSSQKGDASKPISVVDLTSKASAAQRISIKNTGKKRLYVRVIVNGQLAPDQDPGEESTQNIALDIRYLDTKGNPVDVSRLARGSDFIAEVTVRRQSDLKFPFTELALSQIFPSGWEIQNARMTNLQLGGVSPSTYQDVRDDRVYTYFDLPGNTDAETRTYRIQLNAAYAGRYYLPPTSCEAMYDSRIRAATSGRWVEVL